MASIQYGVLRLLFVFFSGYVHPDEQFQGPEVIAHDVFGFKTLIPWEYSDSIRPSRSIVSP